MDTKTFLQGQIASVQRQLDGVMEGLTDEQFNFEPIGTLNTIRAAFMHIVYAQDGYVQQMIGGKPRLWDSSEWSSKIGVTHAPGRGNWEDIKNKFVPLVPVLDYQAEVRAAIGAYLQTLTDTELERQVTSPAGERPVADVLGLLITHTAGHTGEIATLKGIQGLKGLPF